MILFTSGCSFTYGEELDNRMKAWPYVFGSFIGADEVKNVGVCSGSNDYIVRSTMLYISEILDSDIPLSKLFVVLGFTSEMRKECWNDYYKRYIQTKVGREMRILDETQPKTCTLKEVKGNIKQIYDKIIEKYLINFESNIYYNNMLKKQQMINMEYFLNGLGIKHIFFNSLYEKSMQSEKMLNPVYEDYKKTEKLFTYVFQNKEYVIKDYTMEEYCNSLGVPLGKMKHPLEEGHYKWAQYLFKIYERNFK